MTSSLTRSSPPADEAPAPAPGPIRRLANLYGSSVGRKYVMALSGLAIVGFVIAHLVGTLKIFLGPEETDEYGEALRGLGGDVIPHGHLLWILRLGLAAAFAVHLHAAFSLERRNRSARGARRMSHSDHLAATFASRTMLWSGIIVALFIVFHVADLTWGATSSDFVHGAVYDNQIRSFSNPLISLVYLAGVAALTAHLFHGLWSLFQTLAITSPWFPQRVRRRLAVVVATTIGAGYASIPLAVLAGVV